MILIPILFFITFIVGFLTGMILTIGHYEKRIFEDNWFTREEKWQLEEMKDLARRGRAEVRIDGEHWVWKPKKK